MQIARPPKPLIWLHGEVKSPPFSLDARLETGTLLRLLQNGESLSMPQCGDMKSVAPRCQELRIRDKARQWRVIYRIDPDAILILEVFNKTTRKTPQPVIDACRQRLSRYDEAVRAEGKKAKKTKPQAKGEGNG
jgi:phage-related protein